MLEGIVVKGNEKTKTHVITREIKLKVGEPFNAKDAKRSMQKVYNLGFFEDVNIKLIPGREPNAVVFQADIKEQKTGHFNVGGGYNESGGFSTSFGIEDPNFNGTGNKLNFSIQHGISSIDGTGWNIGFTNPWLDDKQTSFSINIFNYVNEVSDYGYKGDNSTLRSTYYRKSKGFDISFGRPQGEYVRNYITLSSRRDTYREYVSGPVNYLEINKTASDYNAEYNSPYIHDNFGVVHSMTLSRVYDSRDNVFDPTEGKRVSLTSEFAGHVFGGQFDYNKYTIDASQYFKVGKQHIVALRLMAGDAAGGIPDIRKYSIGGIDTLRGYEDGEFRGKKMLFTTAEYRYPIAKKVQGVVFVDGGNAWDTGSYQLSTLKYDVGVGLSINTFLGPIRLTFARGDEGNTTKFGFGGQF
jgi:outer membrane protein insertion porin family